MFIPKFIRNWFCKPKRSRSGDALLMFQVKKYYRTLGKDKH